MHTLYMEASNQRANSWVVACLFSLISVLVTQFTLSMIPFFFPNLIFIFLLPLSAVFLAVMLGLVRFCKKIAGVRTSAPAFVFFTILFIWTVHIYVVRQVISLVVDIMFDLEMFLLMVGLWFILSSDPGFVISDSSYLSLSVKSLDGEVETQEEESLTQDIPGVATRVRFCRQCKKYVMGFDHHCPAFGNCIGQRNHAFFIVLLVGFVVSEASFVAYAYEFTCVSPELNGLRWKAMIPRNLVVGAQLFCSIQVVWQVLFIMWHIYCACFNIKTDEWINWRKYPEFQMELVYPSGQGAKGMQFKNPYDNGVLRNLKESLFQRYAVR